MNDHGWIVDERIDLIAFRIRRIRVEAPLPHVAAEVVDRAAGPDLVALRVGLHRRGPSAVAARVATGRDEQAEGEISVFAGGKLFSPGPAPAIAAGRGPLPLRLGRQRLALRFAEFPGLGEAGLVRGVIELLRVVGADLGALRRIAAPRVDAG